VTAMIALALLAGALVSLSRALNGRLALATSALGAFAWNHVVGLGVLVALGLVLGGLLPPGLGSVPFWAWVGGPLGVVFVASGSWLIARIGATLTALMVIAGQMVSGVLLDLLAGVPGSLMWRALGVGLILAGMVLAQRR